MKRPLVPFEDIIHFQLLGDDVDQLRPDPGFCCGDEVANGQSRK